jgi:hypothetical protein
MKLIYEFLKKTIFKPVNVKYCSQTIYEALIGCLRLYDHCKSDIWKKRSEKLCKILIEIQRPDGGFDIGYDFNFGMLHNKGDSTSPELVGLLALVEYYKRFGGEIVEKSSHLAAEWIKNNAFKASDEEWAIPYSPYNTKEVMVYNGTSFAVGALGAYLGIFKNDDLEKIYRGMIKYLFNRMSTDHNNHGKFWFYSDQSRKDLNLFARNKIDYYHQMQQVEMHSIAQNSIPDNYQKQIIELATDHVISTQKKDGVIPYLNTESKIHLWGYCSCLSGFILASEIIENRSEHYLEAANKVANWIYRNAWNGKYFYPILDCHGHPIDKSFYVRSDSWVFNSFSIAILKEIVPIEFLEVCEKCYLLMEKNNFSGAENHASSLRKRMIIKILEIIKKLYP